MVWFQKCVTEISSFFFFLFSLWQMSEYYSSLLSFTWCLVYLTLKIRKLVLLYSKLCIIFQNILFHFSFNLHITRLINNRSLYIFTEFWCVIVKEKSPNISVMTYKKGYFLLKHIYIVGYYTRAPKSSNTAVLWEL